MSLILSGTDGVSDIDGTAATPAIRGTDANTGIFFPAADTIGFAEGGAEAMRIDSSGNVGIGTSSAGDKLSIESSTNSLGNFIGTRNTSTGTSAGSRLRIGNNASENSFVIDAYGGNHSTKANFVEIINVQSAPLVFGTATTERMRIDSSGNVGIGTSSPSSFNALVAIKSASDRDSIQYVGGSSYAMRFGSNASFAAIDGCDAATGSTSYQPICLRGSIVLLNTGGTERARITSGGFLKQSNTGSYADATNTYNEFNSDISNNPCVLIRSTNASYVANSEEVIPSRSATSSYSFYVAASGGGTDIEFRLRGDGNGYADGTWNNNGADYAEFFESANGQALTLGATVVLDGNKVREATDQDPASAIIGVVRAKEPSKASMVVGNTAWNKWANKYLTDDFDRYIMEDHDVVEWEETITDEEGKASTKQHSYESHNIPAGVTVPVDAVRKTHDDKGNKFQHYKLNPAWDKDAEYVNRENRPEWNIIGLLGQVKILKGQPVGDRWIKMRDVSATVEEWMIR